MVDRKQLMDALEHCVLHDPDDVQRCDGCPFLTADNCVNRLKWMSLELLKQAEPIYYPPTRYTDGIYACGSCKCALPDGKPKFCPECGCAVQWEVNG